ncbi:MAG: N-acetyltransferase [Rhizobiaceae bacterium MnEN-MB40S]|nr:MAG: N-acetyltransferase [Rhizobiaceae bacterium MnEN-MB40S]
MQAVRDLLAETWHATYDSIYGVAEVDRITSEWHAYDRLRERLDRPDAEFILADTGQTIAGMAFARCPNGGRVVTLHQLYVAPCFQTQGAGTALLDEICICFPKAQSVRLEVEEANQRAVEFYRRRGFVRTGKAASLSDSGGQTLEFEKSL